jgi:hypothetical protein
MTFVLRKSIGPYSAGTPCEIIGPGKFAETNDIAIGMDQDYLEDVHDSEIVELRPRSMMITTTGRKQEKKVARCLNQLNQ